MADVTREDLNRVEDAIKDGLERVHSRLNDLHRQGERIAVLESQMTDVKMGLSAHGDEFVRQDERIDRLNDRAGTATKAGAGGAVAGGLSVLWAVIKSGTFK